LSIELNGLTLRELEDLVLNMGEKKFRAEQIFNYIHKNKGVDIGDIGTLSKGFREKLKEETFINNISIFEKFQSNIDDTKKYLYLLKDDNIIEAVAMEYKHGTSVCISTQVGCRMGCSFCASTKEGLIRNLTAGEMLDEIYMIEKDLDREVSNVVLMGSGEPLDNYDNVIKFIKILNDDKGRNLSARHITLSTCGIVPNIYKLAEESLPITLAISLHSAFDENRKKIMPISNRYEIAEIIKACKYYLEKTKRRITFEYTLIKGVNDRKEDILELTKILSGIDAHINLIPLNPIEEYREENPSNKHIYRFKEDLEKKGLKATIRREMGRDISASCGQLRRSVLKKRNI